MPLTRISSPLINILPSYPLTGSLNGTASYATTASFAMNGGSGGSGGAVQTGSIANQTILYNVTTSQDNIISGLNLSSNKWDVSVIEEWNSGSGDIYYPSSSVLLHFSGSNNSTTISDSGPNNVSITVSGGAKITSSFSKFGGTSLFLGGTNGNYLTIPVVSGGPLDVNNQNFTVECYIYITATTTGTIVSRYNSNAGSGNYNWDLSLTSTGKLQATINQFNNNNSSNTITGLTTLTTNIWHHIAYVKSSSLQTLFLNGNIDVSGSITIATSDSGQAIRIGASVNLNGSTNAPIAGYIDEFRITKNVVRYTGSFTTSSLEFPNQLPQYETKYVGLIGGLNDTGSDYGVQKLSDSSLKIRKMSVSGTPVSGSPFLSASVDRVYVNVLNYDNVSISGSISNAISSSYSLTASYNLNSVSSSFANTSSYSLNTISSSYSNVANTATSATSATSANTATSSSYATVAGSATSATSATSANTANSATSASYSLSSSFATNAVTATSATSANSATSASYSLSSSYSVNSNTSISSSFSSTASYNLNSISSSFSTTSSYNLNSVSSSYALTASFALNSAGGGGTTLTTGSTYPITSSWAINAITASYALNASGGGSGGSTQTGSIANQTILYNVTTSQDNVISGLNLSSNKWGVTVIEEWNSGSVPGDIFYSSCSLLMHFSGSDGSTTFVDNSSSPKSFTRYGNAQVSTVQSKFGGSSLYLDGTGDYITTTYTTTAFDWWTTDYTIECFIYPNNSSSLSTSTPILIGNADPGSGINYWSFGPNNNKQLSFYYFNGASIFVTSTETTVVINQWNHIAMTKNSTGIRLFINGVASVTSASVSGTPQSSVSYPLVIGQINLSSINAYVDEVRITKGIARYTSSFTVPVSAFPDTQGTIPQYETKYIGLVGGLNDSNVDYGVEKLSDSSLKIRKMTASGQPLSGSGQLSASVDRVYVNVLDYTNVMVTSSYALTASYVLGGIQTGSISNQTILYNVTTSQENTITGLDLSGNKWNVSVIEEWNTISGDLYYNSCSLLMHFSGSNGSTTFIDNSPNNLTVTSNNGAAISTVQSKFGGASAYFDGTNDYLSTPNTVSNFGTDDFTIECWFYRVSTNSILISNATGADNNYFAINADASNAVIQIRDNSSQAFAYGPATALNEWNHIAVTRNNGTVRVFVNGVSGTPVSITKSFTSRSTIIGGFLYTGFEGYFYGYIDELRITKGIARYTSSFATQSIEFSNQVPQYETKYIGLVGGLNDTNIDYGVEKLSDSSLKIRKMSVSGTPISGSPFLSASVDRVYVNVLNYKNVQTTVESASYASTSSYVINAPSGESFHPFLLG